VKQRISPIRIIIAGTSWRLFGSRRAAETLLQAMSGDDEQNRMLAGISLVKAGQRSFDLIENRIKAGKASAPVIRLLPDIGGERARGVLEKIASGDESELQETARECVGLLNRIDAIDEE
jgi:radical SAM superfamily enzyme with C-terminal helix-hairpin-helix motif